MVTDGMACHLVWSPAKEGQRAFQWNQPASPSPPPSRFFWTAQGNG